MRWPHVTLPVCIHPTAHSVYLQGGSDEDYISATSAGSWAMGTIGAGTTPPFTPVLRLVPPLCPAHTTGQCTKKMCLLKCFIFFYRIVQDGRKQLKPFSFNKHLAPDHRSAFIHDIQQEKFPVHYVLCIPSQTLGLSGLHKTVALLHAPGVL